MMNSTKYLKNKKLYRFCSMFSSPLKNQKTMKNLVLICLVLTFKHITAQEIPTTKGKLEFKIHQKIENSEIVKVNNENKIERTSRQNENLDIKEDRKHKKELRLRPHFDLKKEEKVQGSKHENTKHQRENREHSKEHRHDRKEKNKN